MEEKKVDKVLNRLKKVSLKDLLLEKAIYVVLFVLLVTIVIIQPKFLSFGNFKNIFAQSATRIIIALAAGMREKTIDMIHLYLQRGISVIIITTNSYTVNKFDGEIIRIAKGKQLGRTQF